MIKLIVSDLDGTLIGADNQVNSEFYEIFQELKRRKIKFVAASGRQCPNMKEVLSKVKDEIIFVSDNGGMIQEKDEILYMSQFSSTEINEIVQVGMQVPNAGVFLCGSKSAYLIHIDDELREAAETYYSDWKVVDSIDDIDDEIVKISLFEKSNKSAAIFPFFKSFGEKYKFVLGADMWFDIVPQGTSKGTAVVELQKRFNITSEETVVFGDYLNDLEMLKTAKYSYAMKNAHPEVIQQASYITDKANYENGVVHQIKKLLKDEK